MHTERTGDYTDFLARLENEEKQQLLTLGTRKHYLKDETICSLGRTNDEIYILVAGRVKIYELTAEGKEVILWFCTAGELFGIADALTANEIGTRRINARSCGYTELLSVNYQEFLRFVKDYPRVSLPLLQLLSFRLREISEVLSDVTSIDVASRVIKLLHRLGERYGRKVENGVFLELPVTHQEMADMIGASRQTVTTVLGDLRRSGQIQMEHRTLFIRSSCWVNPLTIKNKSSANKLLLSNEKKPADIGV
jgi:CRP/FNR family transcriptional regulator